MFTFSIPITDPSIKVLKSDLRLDLPNVKSSHRIEAMARALGFKSNAALRAVLGHSARAQAPIGGAAFTEYLGQHGFPNESIHIYRAAAHVAICQVLKAEPRLTVWGIGVGRPQRNDDGKYQTANEHQEHFRECRHEFYRLGVFDQFLLSLSCVQKIKRTKTVRSTNGSYGLKHIAENCSFQTSDGMRIGPHYVSNGVLIAAAIFAGFDYRTYMDELGYESLNVSFNMSQRSIDELDREIRPERYVA